MAGSSSSARPGCCRSAGRGSSAADAPWCAPGPAADTSVRAGRMECCALGSERHLDGHGFVTSRSSAMCFDVIGKKRDDDCPAITIYSMVARIIAEFLHQPGLIPHQSERFFSRQETYCTEVTHRCDSHATLQVQVKTRAAVPQIAAGSRSGWIGRWRRDWIARSWGVWNSGKIHSPTWRRRPRWRAERNSSRNTQHGERHPGEVEDDGVGQEVGAEGVVEQDRAHALEDRGRRQRPGDRLQPGGQRRDRVVDAGERLDQEDQRPGEAFGAQPEAQHEAPRSSGPSPSRTRAG